MTLVRQREFPANLSHEKGCSLRGLIRSGIFLLAVGACLLLSANSIGAVELDALNDWKLRHEFAPLLPALKSPFQGVAGGSNLWVAVGDEGSIWTTPEPNAVPWSKQASGTTNFLGVVRFLGGRFVVGGRSGTILTSTDGATWSRFEDGTLSMVNEVAFGNETFVAAGTGGFVWTSANGVSWVRQNIPDAKELSGVVFDGGSFVAIDRSNSPVYTRILSSTNGTAWNVEASGSNAPLGRIAFHDGLYVAVVTSWSGLRIFTSRDRRNWIERIVFPSQLPHFVGDIIWHGDAFYVVGGSVIDGQIATGLIYASKDGINWELRINQSPGLFFAIGGANGRLVAVGGGSFGPYVFPNTVATSADGVSWMEVGKSARLSGVVFGAGQFVTVGDNGTILTSKDGIIWQRATSGTTAHLSDIVFDGQRYVAVGNYGTILSSEDGRTWTSRISDASKGHLTGVTAGNNQFVAVGYSILTSTNGIAWNSPTNSSLNDVAYGNGRFVAVGGFAPKTSPPLQFVCTSTDGVIWAPDLRIGEVFNGVAFGNGVFVAVRPYASIAISSDGSVWNGAALPSVPGPVFPLATFSKVSYESGIFTIVSERGLLATSTNQTNWIVRPTGTSRNLRGIAYGNGTFLAVGESGTILQSGAIKLSTPPAITIQPAHQTVLVAAPAQFSVAVSASAPLQYQWQFNGGDISGATNALLEIKTTTFSRAGNYQLIARNADGIVSSDIVLLSIDPGKAGQPDLAFDAEFKSERYPLPHISAGFPSAYAMAVQPDMRLLVGGDFDTIHGLARRNLARLNPDGSMDLSFEIGTGVDGVVSALALQSDGKVVVGGKFKSIDGSPRNSLARLHTNGSLDESFGSSPGLEGDGFQLNPGTRGMTSVVSSILVESDGRLLVGGAFKKMNGIATGNLVRLLASGAVDNSFMASPGANGTVWAIKQQSDRKILIAGDFTEIHGVKRNFIARLGEDGRLDETFNAGTGTPGPAYCLALQADGRIIVGGRNNGQPEDSPGHGFLKRLGADGKLDSTFAANPAWSGEVFSLALQPDGKILEGGAFLYQVEPFNRNGLVRLSRDGVLDTSFAAIPGLTGGAGWQIARFGGRTYASVRSIAPLNDGTALIAGSFTLVNGYPRNYVARLFLDPQAPPLMNPSRNDDLFRVSVPTLAGRFYLLEYKNTLSEASWQSLPAVKGNGAVKAISDTITNQSQRFYRLRVEQP
jgi:uncharacterized delta-60 repeat protein